MAQFVTSTALSHFACRDLCKFLDNRPNYLSQVTGATWQNKSVVIKSFDREEVSDPLDALSIEAAFLSLLKLSSHFNTSKLPALWRSTFCTAALSVIKLS